VEELEQVNDSIEQAKLALEDLEEKKRFVAMRLETYQEELEQRAKRLRRAEERMHGVREEEEEQEYEETRPLGGTPARNPTPRGVIHQVQDDIDDDDDDTSHEGKDEETTPSLSMEDLEKQKERLQSEQAALERVHVAHAEMERNVLQLQRKIIILERKREEVLTKTRECRDFLVVAAQMQNDDDDDDDDLEEGPFVQSDQRSEEDTEATFLQSDQLLGEGNEGQLLQSDQLSEEGISDPAVS
jgi:chromosome segregation ATPase